MSTIENSHPLSPGRKTFRTNHRLANPSSPSCTMTKEQKTNASVSASPSASRLSTSRFSATTTPDKKMLGGTRSSSHLVVPMTTTTTTLSISSAASATSLPVAVSSSAYPPSTCPSTSSTCPSTSSTCSSSTSSISSTGSTASLQAGQSLLRTPPRRVPRPAQPSPLTANVTRQSTSARSSRHIMVPATTKENRASLSPSLNEVFMDASASFPEEKESSKEEISVLVHTFSNLWQRKGLATAPAQKSRSQSKGKLFQESKLDQEDEDTPFLDALPYSPSKKKHTASKSQKLETPTKSDEANQLRRSPRLASTSPFYGSHSSQSLRATTPLKKQALLKSVLQQEQESQGRDTESERDSVGNEPGLDPFSRLITSSPRRAASVKSATPTPLRTTTLENKENAISSSSSSPVLSSMKSPRGHSSARSAAATVVTRLKKLISHSKEQKNEEENATLPTPEIVRESTQQTCTLTESRSTMNSTASAMTLSTDTSEIPEMVAVLPPSPNASMPVSMSGSNLFSPSFTHVPLEPELIATIEECSVDPHAEFDVLCEEFVEAVQFIATLPNKSSLPPHPRLPKNPTSTAASNKSTKTTSLPYSSRTLDMQEVKLRTTFHSFPFCYGVLPQKAEEHRDLLTLVLDLDETLVHCSVGKMVPCDLTFKLEVPGRQGMPFEVSVRWRPHLFTFLNLIRGKFEVILFTASQKIYADTLLDMMDPEKRIFHHRLFRDSCRWVNGNFIKDLDVLDRDLSQTIIVDNAHQAYSYNVSNGYPIASWYDDPNDTGLMRLWDFLEKEALPSAGVQDIRYLMKHKFPLHKHIMQYRKQHLIQSDFDECDETEDFFPSDVPMNNIHCYHTATY